MTNVPGRVMLSDSEASQGAMLSNRATRCFAAAQHDTGDDLSLQARHYCM